MAKRVFFIESEKFLRDMAELLFKNRGYEIYTTAKIKDHFYLLDDLLPDVVVFDLGTVLDGDMIETSLELKELLTYSKKIKLIAIVDQSTDDSGLHTLNKKVDKILTKPIVAQELVDQVF